MNSRNKGPEIAVCLVYWKNNMEAREEEVESRGARPWEAFLAITGTWILN